MLVDLVCPTEIIHFFIRSWKYKYSLTNYFNFTEKW